MERYIPVAQTQRLVIVFFCKQDTKERYWAVVDGYRPLDKGEPGGAFMQTLI